MQRCERIYSKHTCSQHSASLPPWVVEEAQCVLSPDPWQAGLVVESCKPIQGVHLLDPRLDHQHPVNSSTWVKMQLVNLMVYLKTSQNTRGYLGNINQKKKTVVKPWDPKYSISCHWIHYVQSRITLSPWGENNNNNHVLLCSILLMTGLSYTSAYLFLAVKLLQCVLQVVDVRPVLQRRGSRSDESRTWSSGRPAEE